MVSNCTKISTGGALATALFATAMMSNTATFSMPKNTRDYALYSSFEMSASNKYDLPDLLNNSSSYRIVFNVDTTIDSTKTLMIKNNIDTLTQCINEEPVEPGADVSYFDFFMALRNDENYRELFDILISSPFEAIRQSVINLLSVVPYDDIMPIEQAFVINSLRSEYLLTQDYALNAVSLWNDKDIFSQISTLSFKNRLLQRRFEKVISVIRG